MNSGKKQKLIINQLSAKKIKNYLKNKINVTFTEMNFPPGVLFIYGNKREVLIPLMINQLRI